MKNYMPTGEEQSKSGHPRATSQDLIDFCKPIAKRQPDVSIIHVGKNDLRIKDEKEIAKNIVTIYKEHN